MSLSVGVFQLRINSFAVQFFTHFLLFHKTILSSTFVSLIVFFISPLTSCASSGTLKAERKKRKNVESRKTNSFIGKKFMKIVIKRDRGTAVMVNRFYLQLLISRVSIYFPIFLFSPKLNWMERFLSSRWRRMLRPCRFLNITNSHKLSRFPSINPPHTAT